MRPARAAAENTPAKPGQQPSFSQSATVPLEPEPRRHPVTPARDARKEGSLMRPARAAAQNTPAKPGRRSSFSQSDQTMTPAARRLPVIDENDEIAQHSTQSRSDLHDPSIALATATWHRALSKSWDSPMVPTRTRRGHPVTPPRDARKEGSLMRPARAAAENKNTTRSSSAPKKKLSGASLFLAEMVRRRMVSESELNIT